MFRSLQVCLAAAAVAAAGMLGLSRGAIQPETSKPTKKIAVCLLPKKKGVPYFIELLLGRRRGRERARQRRTDL